MAVCGFSLVVMNGGYSLVADCGVVFSLRWLLLLQSIGFSCSEACGSQARDWTSLPRIDRWILNHWTTREVLAFFIRNSRKDYHHSRAAFVGGGIGMGNTCKPMADSFQCMTKSTTIKEKKRAAFIQAFSLWIFFSIFCDKTLKSLVIITRIFLILFLSTFLLKQNLTDC